MPQIRRKPRPRPTPSPIQVCEVPGTWQLPLQTVPGRRLGETEGGRATDTLESAQVWGGAEGDADGFGFKPVWSRYPGRSARITPVGGLRAAFWVAREEPGRVRLTAIAQQQNLASLGWQWKAILFSTLRRASQLTPTLLVITKVKGNLRVGQSLSQPLSQWTCCCV